MQVRRKVAHFLCGTETDELVEKENQILAEHVPFRDQLRGAKRLIYEISLIEFWGFRIIPNLTTLYAITAGDWKLGIASEAVRYFGEKLTRKMMARTIDYYLKLYKEYNEGTLPEIRDPTPGPITSE